MITEAYISFEVAKLLKEKGFDESVTHYYFTQITHVGIKDYPTGILYTDSYPQHQNNYKNKVAAPTLQMAMKWLRKEKGIAVVPIVSSILDDEKFIWDVEMIVAKTHDTYHQGWKYETYEGAAERGLEYCLRDLI